MEKQNMVHIQCSYILDEHLSWDVFQDKNYKAHWCCMQEVASSWQALFRLKLSRQSAVIEAAGAIYLMQQYILAIEM